MEPVGVGLADRLGNREAHASALFYASGYPASYGTLYIHSDPMLTWSMVTVSILTQSCLCW
jgi:hypothetical protein